MPDDVSDSRYESYNFVFRSTADGILIADAARQIENANPAALAMLDVTREKLIGSKPETIFRKLPTLVSLLQKNEDVTIDVRLPRKRLAVGIGTTLSNGKRLVLLQDVTEKRDLESRRESLVGTMSHDLRNPISALGGFAELIGKFGDLNDSQQRFVTRIRQTTTKLYDTVGSLVDLAWIEAGMPLAHEPISLVTTINRAVKDLTSLAHDKHITIAVSLQNPLPTIMGDPERIYVVVYNLIHNAIMYSFEYQTVAVHAWSDLAEVYFSVADRGIGITEDEVELVFDRLYRSRDERVRETPGGGLGLTVARTILQRHGGSVSVASQLGLGSTFTVVLPTTTQM